MELNFELNQDNDAKERMGTYKILNVNGSKTSVLHVILTPHSAITKRNNMTS